MPPHDTGATAGSLGATREHCRLSSSVEDIGVLPAAVSSGVAAGCALSMGLPSGNVRDLVNGFKREILAGNLGAHRASEIEQALTALLGNIQDEARNADFLYAEVYAKCLREAGKANRAKVMSETTQEYLHKRMVHDTHTLCVELIRSMRGLVRMATEELRLTR